MTNKQSAKKTFLLSVLSLLLCVSMLIGTTFAWFTDSVTSANNVIQSGNLDIELEYWKDGEWVDVAGKTDVLTNLLWEPGVTEVAYLRVANAGSLALKYQLGINIVAEIEGKNAAGETFKLSDYIMFGVVEGIDVDATTTAPALYADRAAAVAAVTDAKVISAGYTKAEAMAAGDELYIALVVYMPTTVANEANHNGTDIPQIDLGINVIATQVTAEEDSFGADYDSDAAFVSAPVARDEAAANGVNLKGANDVVVSLSPEIIDALPAGVEEIGMAVSDPVIVGNTVSFAEIELVDQNGDKIDLDALGLAENITVTLPLPEAAPFAAGEEVMIYHDGAYVATAVVDANGKISYDVAHLCEVTVGAIEAPVVNGDTVEIANVAQLIAFAQSVNAGNNYAGKTVVLTADIDLNNVEWTPIGSFVYDRTASTYANVVTFNGTFDGQGHTISNLKAHAPTTDGVALFGCVEAATIKNVTVHNVDIVAGSHAAAILARGYQYSKTTTVANCHVTGNIEILIDWAYAGGIVAKATGLNISDCTVMPTGTGSITASNRNAVGGIVGWVETVGATVVSNCHVANMNLTGWTNVGSINGYIQAGCTIDGCSAENIVLTKTRIDGHPAIGLVSGGWSYNATKPVTITNNTVTNITLNGTHVAKDSANVLYGAEYSGNSNSNFVLENNTTENVTNNLIVVVKVTTATELKEAVANGATNIALADGEYNVANCGGGKTLNIYGSKNAIIKIMNEGENGADYGFDGSNVTFNGVTIDTTANNGSYKGFARMIATYNNCAFIGGGFTTFSSSSFNNCTFDLSGYIWTWGATEVNFTACTFTGDSRTILAHGSASTVINITDCDFAATSKGHTGSGDWTAAVEIDPTGSNFYTINFLGENSLNANYSGWTRVKDGSTGHIVNGLN